MPCTSLIILNLNFVNAYISRCVNKFVKITMNLEFFKTNFTLFYILQIIIIRRKVHLFKSIIYEANGNQSVHI